MAEPAYPTSPHDFDSEAEERERLEAAAGEGPRGALAVSGIAVSLLMLCWLIIYFFVFLPRGTIG